MARPTKPSLYPADELCLARKKRDPGPCQNPRGSCKLHCGADNTSQPGRCAAFPMDNGRCRKHGGKTPKGLSSPNFRHGGFAKDMIANLQERFEEELGNPELLSLNEEIALLRALIRDVMERGESGYRWRDISRTSRAVGKAIRKLHRAIQSGDVTMLQQARHDLDDAYAEEDAVVKGGVRDAAHRDELGRRAESVARVKNVEHKHRIDERLAVTHEQLAVEIAFIAGLMKKHIKDKGVFNAISAELGERVAGLRRGADLEHSQN